MNFKNILITLAIIFLLCVGIYYAVKGAVHLLAFAGLSLLVLAIIALVIWLFMKRDSTDDPQS